MRESSNDNSNEEIKWFVRGVGTLIETSRVLSKWPIANEPFCRVGTGPRHIHDMARGIYGQYPAHKTTQKCDGLRTRKQCVS